MKKGRSTRGWDKCPPNDAVKRQIQQAMAQRNPKVHRPVPPRIKARLPVDDRPLEIWVPGLVLRSENEILGSAKHGNRGATGEARSEAKQESVSALLEAAAATPLWRFEGRVAIEFRQLHKSHNGNLIDSENLCTKWALDLMTERGIQMHRKFGRTYSVPGLGIIPDDRPRFVGPVTRHNEIEPAPETGVLIIVKPYTGKES